LTLGYDWVGGTPENLAACLGVGGQLKQSGTYVEDEQINHPAVYELRHDL